MQSKLQELTDKLYNEGLSKGRAEGEQLLKNAREEADKLVKEAQDQAMAIVGKARKDAVDLAEKAKSDIRMASEQSLQATKKDIENLVVGKITDSKVDTALADTAFVKEIISAVAAKFSAQQSCDLSLVLPEKLNSQLEPWVGSELSKTLGKEVEAKFSKKVSGGFTIGPKDGSYFISFTSDTFKELIAEYLRPVTRKILFGE